MKIGIIGCGLIGSKRAKAIEKDDSIDLIYDIDKDKLKKLSSSTGAKIASSEDEILNSEVDAIFISTTHNLLAKLSLQAIKCGKHVLVEKPGTCSSKDLKKIINAANKYNVKVKVGFNHRFHPAIFQAHEMIIKKNLGEVLFIRGRYGHGGRIGYENEWRCDKKISGGGELLDQGSHLIDLSLWFMGDLKTDYKNLPTYFWDTNVEDNCFLSLKNKKNNVAWLHASWTEWKNTFSFEIYTKKAKLMISGLGGSYGKERLYYYKMLPKMGPPNVTKFEYGHEDISWKKEFKNFKNSIKRSSKLCGDLVDAYKVIKLVESIYKK